MNKKSLNKTKIIDKFDFIYVDSDWCLTCNDKIYLTKNGNKVSVPNENFLELLRQEFRCLKIKNNTSPSLIEILINYADKSTYGESAYVDEFIKYLETDLLFYRVTSPKSLSESQSSKWDKIINIFDITFQTTWHVSTFIMPIKQDPVSILKIKEYLMSVSILNLHIMSYLLKVTGSCIITVLCNLKKLSLEEAWEAVYVEELWYNKIYNDDEKSKELDSKMSEVDFYFKLLDSI